MAIIPLTPEIIAVIKEVAAMRGIEPRTVGAFILQESAGRAEVTRYEALWKHFIEFPAWAKRTGVTALTEYHEQAISWGLMQVMGSRARELGFRGLLPELASPRTGLMFGCIVLQDIARRFNLPRVPMIKLSDELACAYNHGSPQKSLQTGHWVVQDYVDSIWQHYASIKGIL